MAALTQDQSPRWRLVMIFFEGVVDGRRGVAAHARHPMAVGVEGELDRGVTEPVWTYFGWTPFASNSVT